MIAWLQALRGWGADQQVALLFVVLFGTLALASAVLGVLVLRAGDGAVDGTANGAAGGPAGAAPAVAAADPRARRRRSLRDQRIDRSLRDLRAVWFGAVLFWLAWVSGPPGATALFGVLSFLALREYVTLLKTRRGDHRSLIAAFFIVLPVQYALVALGSADLFAVWIPVYTFLAIPVVSALAGDPERFLERNAGIQWGLTVCVYGLSHAPALLLLKVAGGRGAFLLFFLVVATAAAQIAQELASRRLRRRPLARRIDRSFSWRAYGIGVASAALLGLAMFWLTPFGPLTATGLALLAGGTGQLGELVMSALKRDAGVASWGNAPALTGAVGLIDRIAPLCFAAPVFFHAVRGLLQGVD